MVNEAIMEASASFSLKNEQMTGTSLRNKEFYKPLPHYRKKPYIYSKCISPLDVCLCQDKVVECAQSQRCIHHSCLSPLLGNCCDAFIMRWSIVCIFHDRLQPLLSTGRQYSCSPLWAMQRPYSVQHVQHLLQGNIPLDAI